MLLGALEPIAASTAWSMTRAQVRSVVLEIFPFPPPIEYAWQRNLIFCNECYCKHAMHSGHIKPVHMLPNVLGCVWPRRLLFFRFRFFIFAFRCLFAFGVSQNRFVLISVHSSFNFSSQQSKHFPPRIVRISYNSPPCLYLFDLDPATTGIIKVNFQK